MKGSIGLTTVGAAFLAACCLGGCGGSAESPASTPSAGSGTTTAAKDRYQCACGKIKTVDAGAIVPS